MLSALYFTEAFGVTHIACYRCKKWITNCRQKDLEHFLKRSSDYLYFNHKLCANHFDDSQFANKMRNRYFYVVLRPVLLCL